MNNAISIRNLEIKMNDAGMYCLNDLHKASGGLDKHRPTEFMRRDQTVGLIQELGNCGFKPQLITSKTAGRYGGTYVCKELVYLYAMWVSAKFNLDVIRVFDGQTKARTELDCLIDNVKSSSARLASQINKTSLSLAEIKSHGHSWGAYGHAIRKAKREAIKELESIKQLIQIELDFIE